ncbi:MAG: HNH endonuclease signature motif containing protein [Spirochaetota bacterium]|nr:HNH endonuclease signature motif containing protein [Spirochaetota bacterium]
MRPKKEKKGKRDRLRSEINEFTYTVDEFIAKEKMKARSLRNSSWWRRKTATGVCHYCGGKCSPDNLTMDHLIPLSRGGRSEKVNIVPACKDCNNKKKYLLPVEWEEYLNLLRNTEK